MIVSNNTGTGVRIFNASTLAKPVDIFFNDNLVSKNLKYRMASNYKSIPTGMYNIKIYDSESGVLIYNETIKIEGNKFMTLSAINDLGKLQLIVLEDYMVNRQFLHDNRSNLMIGNTIKRVVDAFNNVVEIVVNRIGVIIENVIDQLGNVIIKVGDRIKKVIDRVGNVIEVIINNVGRVIAVVIDGINTVIEGLVDRIGDTVKKVIDQFGNIIDVVVDDLQNIVGWVIDEIGDLFTPNGLLPSPGALLPPLTPPLIPQVSNNQAQLRLVHLSPNSPSIDLTLPDGTRFSMDTKYKEVTNYNPIGITAKTLQIRPMGRDQVILNIEGLNFAPNKLYTLYIIGILNGTPRLEAVLLQDGI